MSEIVIDTNVLYSWAELSPNPNLPHDKIEELLSEHTLYITSISIIECLVKFKNDLEKIQQCLEPIRRNKFKVLNVAFIPLPIGLIDKIINARSISEIDKDIGEMYELKIKEETKFTSFFFLPTLGAVIYSFLKEHKTLTDEIRNNFIAHNNSMLSRANIDFIKKQFRAAIEDGYREDKVQKMVKDKFSELLSIFIYASKISEYTVKNSMSFAYIDLDKVSDTKNKFGNDSVIKKLKRSGLSDNPMVIFKNRKYKNIFIEHIDKVIKELRIDIKITDHVLKYIEYKLKKMLLDQAKFNKNDIPDMLILYVLDSKDYILLTLDNDLNRFLKSIGHPSHEFIDSIL